MALINKQKNTKVEVDYLQTSETVNRPTAVVFTIIMVLVLAAAAFSIFLGGRWLYENLDGSDKAPQDVVVTNPITETTPSAASTSASNTGNSQASQTGSTTAAGSSASSTSNTGTATTTQIQSQSIPATGPTETFALFIASSIIAAGAHFAWQKRTNTYLD